MSHIRIEAVEIHHPANAVDNEFYFDHFDKQNNDIRRFLEHMGRKSRYVIDSDEENGLTMGIEAARKVLAKAGLQGTDIDMVVFSTQVPETTFPVNALYIHAAIGADAHTMVLDSNANCAGMVVAVDHASRYMLSAPNIRRALIVGSDYNTLVSDPDSAITYANYGDAAAAVILERTEEQTGFIDSIYHTDPVNRDFIRYPAEGLAKTVKHGSESKGILWLPFEAHAAMPPTFEMFETLLGRHGLTPQEIGSYCLSQFSLENVLKIQRQYGLSDEQMVYVGDRFGYTGTSSPFIALHEAVETGRVKRGDHVLFWSIGSGFQLVAMLFKY
ncbi:3-oxoacyl-[acyl-carrier-protein] synthase III C-terminal domain-containing protein [Saccharibacillus sp. CPCC 101409]|uniref:3-oxoacyl-[acyl-carrier-protein] synthase III C-terminal domain-containing protein n=1 Tax=Saccharibacillus sp. CPCC 101409 TaxID=3058041 RepID=UPI00267252AB|nr:3-oxoacyl-[acyl-carrier-protein] synthase III C-terminal domain-containing protein [Saccharibacillus sp. CPCC 101409]MDO3413067.1 3-oxoacyl-[acyl-carrier-protein] synthase III C-terminal domain-containing protein [Saccharibacillus sp. CPCC 101409]